jgi:RNA polymerase sigma-B factor
MMPAARDHAIVAYRYLCLRGARKFLRPGLERCDLEQVAAIGLIKAYDRYDTTLKTPFEAYAWMMIVGELMHHVRDHERIVRVPRWLRNLERHCARAHEQLSSRLEREPSNAEIATQVGVPTALIPQLRRGDAVVRYEQVLVHQQETVAPEDRILVSRAVSALDALQRKIVLGIYGLGMTQVELARQTGISVRHLSRLHTRALGALRRALSEPGTDKASNRKIVMRSTP